MSGKALPGATAERAQTAAGNRLRVAAVVPQTGRRANGGVESFTQILEHLPDIDFVVVTQAETDHTRRWRRAGARVYVWDEPLPRGRLRAKATEIGRFNRRLFSLVRSAGADVLHCNDLPGVILAIGAAVGSGVPLSIGVRDTPAAGERWRLRWRLLSRRADRLIALSADARARTTEALGLGDTDKAEFVYSIVDLDRMRPPTGREREEARRRLGIAPDEFAVGYVGVVNAKKAQLDFIQRALPTLARQPHLRVHFVGDFDPENDPYGRACRNAVDRLDRAGAARFVGFSDSVEEWYRALDLVVLASRREGMARCMIESIACGTPVVSFDVSSAREILEQHGCGIVIESGDYVALVAAVTQMESSPERREEMGRKGADAARRLFAADAAAAEYRRIWTRIAAPTSPVSPGIHA